MKKNKMLTSMVSVGLILSLGKLVGFIKQMVVASYYGTTLETDIFFLSNGFVNEVGTIITMALSAAFVSVYVGLSSAGIKNATNRFVGDAIAVFCTISVVLTALIWVGAPAIAQVIAPTYVGDRFSQLVHSIRFFSFSLVLLTVLCIFKSVLEANKRFEPPQVIGIVQSLVLIVGTILLAERFGVQVLNMSAYIALVFNIFILFFYFRKKNIPEFGNLFKNKAITQCLWLSCPLFCGYLLLELNMVVDKIISSGLGNGAVSMLSYGQTVAEMVTSVVKTAVGSVLFTNFAVFSAENKYDEIAKLTYKAINILCFILLPITIITVMCSEDIVSIIYLRGYFTTESVKSTAQSLAGYAVGFCPIAIVTIFSKAHYSCGNMKIPMLLNSIGVIINIVLSVVLSRVMGIGGIALASSIGLLCVALFLMPTMKKISDGFRYHGMWHVLIIAIICCFCCFLAVKFAAAITMNLNPMMNFFVATLFGIIGYMAPIPFFYRTIKEKYGI